VRTVILIKQVEAFAPERIGRKDILIGGEKILEISDRRIDTGNLPVTMIEGKGKFLVPGLIDSHVHICGGGGEGGYKTRTPEMKMTEMIRAGVTTVVGCLGTDGITRTMENLVSKAYSLREEGVSAWCYSGSYQVPVRTLTGDIMKDVMLVDPIIGIGEIALNDHRSSSPTVEELARMTSEARVGGMLSGKAGVVNCHLGDGDFDLDQIEEVLERFVLPISQFIPTHMNRNPRLFEKGIRHALKGGMVDMTTSTTPQFIEEGEVPAAEGLYRMKQAGVALSRITFTSDGHGILPKFGPNGEFEGFAVGRLDSLIESVREAVNQFNIPLEEAIEPVTSTPASYLKLNSKGRISVGKDADLVLLDQAHLEIQHVIARGRICMAEGVMQVRNTVEMD
jgi:beta-aspartyl-dipeptidase (metallo-type)